jgi:hypothetical protein
MTEASRRRRGHQSSTGICLRNDCTLCVVRMYEEGCGSWRLARLWSTGVIGAGMVAGSPASTTSHSSARQICVVGVYKNGIPARGWNTTENVNLNEDQCDGAGF